MKNFLLGILFSLLVLIIGGFAYLRLGFAEVRADVPPGKWETALMFSTAHASVRRRAPELPNPVPGTDENLIAWRKNLSQRVCGMPWDAWQTGFGSFLISANSAASNRRDHLHRGANLLRGQAWHPVVRNVCQWPMGFRPEIMDGGRLHQAHEFAPCPCRARVSQT